MLPPDDDTVVVVLTTLSDDASARAFASRLVDERMVACATIVPTVTSVYRWEGAVREEGESLVVMKSTAARAEELTARIDAIHPYDVPEVLVLPVTGGASAYLAWVASEVSG